MKAGLALSESQSGRLLGSRTHVCMYVLAKQQSLFPSRPTDQGRFWSMLIDGLGSFAQSLFGIFVYVMMISRERVTAIITEPHETHITTT